MPLSGGTRRALDCALAVFGAGEEVADAIDAGGGGGGGGGSGTVTSVALSLPNIITVSGSPITTTGTLAGTLASQGANRVFAGPTSGSASAPTFRVLAAADIPDLSSAYDAAGAAAAITKTSIGLGNVENTALSTWAGSTSITTLGTITTGTVPVARVSGLGSLATQSGTFSGTSSGTNTGDQTITLTGHVTGSGVGSFVTTIGASVVTNAMLAGSIAASKLVGSDIATVGTITVGVWQGSAIADSFIASASTWNAKQAAGSYITALTGDATASGPGSTAITLANTAVTAGSYTLASLTVDAKGRITAASSGSAGSGTVTSVGLTLPSIITVSGSPVTTSGSLTGTLATQSANAVFAGPTSSPSATPTFRALVASDIPDISATYETVAALGSWAGSTSLTTLGTITTGTWSATTITVAKGGTGATTLTGIIKGSGTSALSAATEGTDYLSGVSAKLPLPFTFTGTGTPTIANDLCPWLYVGYAATVVRLTLSCISAPTGSFTVVVKRSADSGSTFPDTIATVTVSSGNRIATTTTIANAALAAGDYLRLDITAVNAAANWTARISTVSKNQ